MGDEPAPAPRPGIRWRGIDELATLVGAYCWVEQRIFAMTGEWATGHAEGPAEAELRVWCAAASRRHGALAARWAERLPVRADADADALITPPAGPLPARLDGLAGEPVLRRGVVALVEGLLPGLVAVYDAHRQAASPVSEGPVLEVLAGAHRVVAAEIRGGRTLLGENPRRPDGGDGPRREGGDGEAPVRELFERLLNESHVFPAVWAS